MAWWTDHAVPRLADRSLGSSAVHKLRDRVCAGLTGELLEIGFGSGLNVSHYPDSVKSVDAIEPSGVAWAMAAKRIEHSSVPVRRAGLDGQVIGAPDASYDSALSTFSLCTIPDVDRALAEVRRVLRPEGTFHFLEHGLAPSAGVARWQSRLNPLQRRIAGGCTLDRPIRSLVEGAGFVIQDITNEFLPGPALVKPFGHLYLGVARA